MKLLGVAELPVQSNEGAGKLISDATQSFLMDWLCSDCIQTMVFDTTSSNTGHVTAACISIQEKLDRPLFWCASRHHIGEILLSHLWEDLKLETSKGPKISIFTRFQVNFKILTSKDPSNYCFAPNSPENTNIIIMCQRVLSNQNMRGDYKELAQLIIMYLDGGNTLFNIQAPGALHRARWMAKLIYSLKIILLSSKIHQELCRGAIFFQRPGNKA